MNTNIATIAQRSGMTHAEDVGCGFPNIVYPPNTEKFAVMLIEEAARHIKEIGGWCGGHGEPQCPTPDELARRMKEHFGVKT